MECDRKLPFPKYQVKCFDLVLPCSHTVQTMDNTMQCMFTVSMFCCHYKYRTPSKVKLLPCCNACWNLAWSTLAPLVFNCQLARVSLHSASVPLHVFALSLLVHISVAKQCLQIFGNIPPFSFVLRAENTLVLWWRQGLQRDFTPKASLCGSRKCRWFLLPSSWCIREVAQQRNTMPCLGHSLTPVTPVSKTAPPAESPLFMTFWKFPVHCKLLMNMSIDMWCY